MAEQMRRPSRFRLLAAAVAVLAFIAYAVAWRIAASEMKEAVHQWVDDQRAAGLVVEHGAVAAGGFPLFIRVEIDKPSVGVPGAWRWRGEALRLDARPWNFGRLGFAPRGGQILWARGYGEWRARADVYFTVAGDKKRGWVFSLSIAEGAMTRESDGARARLTALDLALGPAATSPSTLSLALTLAKLEADLSGETFTLANLQTDLSLSQTPSLVPPDPAAQWRAAGGVLAIRTLKAELDGARLSAEGTIGLDDNLQPAGLLHAELVNPAGLAPLLAHAGGLTREEAEAAAARLTLMAIAGGGKIAAPVELKDGEASIGGVKLADLPNLN